MDWRKRKLNIVTLNLVVGAFIGLCVLILSFAHAAALFARSGYKNWLSYVGVAGFEFAFILGTVTLIWAKLNGEQVGKSTKFVFGLGVVINLYSNITSGLAVDGKPLIFYRINDNLVIGEPVLVGGLIPLLIVAAEMVISDAILKYRSITKKPQPEPSPKPEPQPPKVVNQFGSRHQNHNQFRDPCENHFKTKMVNDQNDQNQISNHYQNQNHFDNHFENGDNQLPEKMVNDQMDGEMVKPNDSNGSTISGHDDNHFENHFDNQHQNQNEINQMDNQNQNQIDENGDNQNHFEEKLVNQNGNQNGEQNQTKNQIEKVVNQVGDEVNHFYNHNQIGSKNSDEDGNDDSEFERVKQIALDVYNKTGKIPGRVKLSKLTGCKDKIARDVLKELKPLKEKQKAS